MHRSERLFKLLSLEAECTGTIPGDVGLLPLPTSPLVLVMDNRGAGCGRLICCNDPPFVLQPSGNSTDELVVNSGRLTPGFRVSFEGWPGPPTPVGAEAVAEVVVDGVVVVAD